MDGEGWYRPAFGDLNEQLVRNKPATFFLRVNGDAMVNDKIVCPASMVLPDKH